MTTSSTAPLVLVTGAGGFIGSHLVEMLLCEGVQVRALVHYNANGHWGHLESHRLVATKGLEVVLGDVRDAYQMRAVVTGCDTVFHLAALIGIPYSYAAPASYVDTNISGTLHLLEAAKATGVRRFVHTSTSEVYGTARYAPIDEAHPLQGQSPYSASKIGADKLVESYFNSFSLPTITIRPFNTYGPRQSARAVLPTIIGQALRGKIVRLGSLTPVRDLTFVTDTAAGFVSAMRAPDSAVGGTYNLGTGEAVTIGELAETVFEILGGGYEIVTDAERIRPDASEVMKLLSDNRLAASALGWQPTLSLAAGLRQTVAWFRKNGTANLALRYDR